MGLGRITKAGLKNIVGVKPGKGFLCPTVFAQPDFWHGCRQIIINNGRDHTAKKLEGSDITIKKGLLPFTWITANNVKPLQKGDRPLSLYLPENLVTRELNLRASLIIVPGMSQPASF